MSLFDYAAAAQTAIELIRDFGQEATLIRKGATTGPSYDPTQGADTEIPIRLVDLNRLQNNRTGDTLEFVGQRTVYISTEELNGEIVSVLLSDQIRIGNELPSDIKDVRPLNPAGVNVMWEVDLVR